MNILGIDYGQRNIGLAWAQTGLNVVLPYGVIHHDNTESVPKALLERINEEGIDQLVVGLPYDDDGNETAHTKRIRAFAKALQEQSGLELSFADERYTSAEADEMGGDASRDEKAAMLILQTYLDEHR